MIELQGIRMCYGDFCALEEVSLTAQNGSVVGIAGFNGAGKTTLLKVVAGVFVPKAARHSWTERMRSTMMPSASSCSF